jgi:antitoxin ParD1/3/4
MTISTQLTNDLETRLQSYAVGDHFEQFIRQQIEAGRYASASEIVREALHLLETQERLREIELEEYREKIREGIESGPGIPAEEVFARLEAKYQAMIDQQA